MSDIKVSRLESIRVAGWKSLKAVPKLDLGAINVFIGPNNTGKSNLISFFRLIDEIRLLKLQEFIRSSGGGDSVLYRGSKVTTAMEAELALTPSATTGITISNLTPLLMTPLFFPEEIITYQNIGNPASISEDLGSGHRESMLSAPQGTSVPWGQFVRFLSRCCRVYHFHDTSDAAPIRNWCYVVGYPALHSDAHNLAEYCAFTKRPIRRPTPRLLQLSARYFQHSAILSLRQKLGPKDVVWPPNAKDYPKKVILNWKQQGREYLLGPHQFSDGTLRAIALITLFLQPEADRPDLIVLDEPELGLHPQAIELIAGLIRAASQKTQIILATQSPTFVDQFHPEEIIVTDMVDGSSRFSTTGAVATGRLA